MERYLDSIVSYLEKNPVVLSSNNADGRLNSAENEDEILEKLCEVNFGASIDRPTIRAWYDFSISDNHGKIYVNIKVSDLSNTAADNLSSKQGMGYALTGIEGIPDNWKKFNEIVSKNIKSGYDYYFLIINKTNPKDVFWTSLKRIRRLQANGNNLPFQCNWASNREWSNRTEEEATKYILETYLDSWNKKINGYPGEIKTLLDRGEIHSLMHYGLY
jgi:hypothetical protein